MQHRRRWPPWLWLVPFFPWEEETKEMKMKWGSIFLSWASCHTAVPHCPKATFLLSHKEKPQLPQQSTIVAGVDFQSSLACLNEGRSSSSGAEVAFGCCDRQNQPALLTRRLTAYSSGERDTKAVLNLCSRSYLKKPSRGSLGPNLLYSTVFRDCPGGRTQSSANHFSHVV